jgi:hypothetical protein
MMFYADSGSWRYIGGIARPVINVPGSLDDASHDQGRFWGLSMARAHQLLPAVTTVVYFNRRDQSGARYDQGIADEQRYSLARAGRGVTLSGTTTSRRAFSLAISVTPRSELGTLQLTMAGRGLPCDSGRVLACA